MNGERSEDVAPDFEGHAERECGEHRTTGGRAWCFSCSEWCYENIPCKGCEVPMLRAVLRRARAEIDRWGYGDFHWGEQPRDPGVLAMLAEIDRVLEADYFGSQDGAK